MKRLRIFINRNAHFSSQPNYLSTELRVLDWHSYPGRSFPQNFNGKNLVVLKFDESFTVELGDESLKNFQKLIILKFSKCKSLTKIPDMSGLHSLETLNIVGCNNLVEVHQSIAFLDKLVELAITNCESLTRFPSSLKLRSLKSLSLCYCERLQKFPEIDSEMKWLTSVELEHMTAIKEILELPPNIEEVNFSGCRSLEIFPELSKMFEFNTSSLHKLWSVNLSGCHKMVVNPIRFEEYVEDLDEDCELIFPGKKIPDWDYHGKLELPNSYICDGINVNLVYSDEIKGFIACAAVQSDPSQGYFFPYNDIMELEIYYNGVYQYNGYSLPFTFSDNLLLHYSKLDLLELSKPVGGILQLKFVFKYGRVLIRSLGIRVVRKQKEINTLQDVANWSPSVNIQPSSKTRIIELYPESSDEENESDDENPNEDLELRVRLVEKHEENARVLHEDVGAHFGKRRRDEDDCNGLEFNWYPHQKRQYSSTMGIRITELENDDENSKEDLDLELKLGL